MVRFVSYSTAEQEEHKFLVRWREDGQEYAICDTLEEAEKLQEEKQKVYDFVDIYDVDNDYIYCS